MYCRTKLPSHMWTPSCFFWRCHGSFNEIGLRWPQFIHKEGKDQREKCEPHIWRRICDNINECKKTFEKVEKLICTVWIIEVSLSYVDTSSTVDTWWCTVECPCMTSFTVFESNHLNLNSQLRSTDSTGFSWPSAMDPYITLERFCMSILKYVWSVRLSLTLEVLRWSSCHLSYLSAFNKCGFFHPGGSCFCIKASVISCGSCRTLDGSLCFFYRIAYLGLCFICHGKFIVLFMHASDQWLYISASGKIWTLLIVRPSMCSQNP